MRAVVALCLPLSLAAFAAPKIIQASGETITGFSPSSGPARALIAVHGLDCSSPTASPLAG